MTKKEERQYELTYAAKMILDSIKYGYRDELDIRDNAICLLKGIK